MLKEVLEIPMANILVDNSFNCRGDFSALDVADLAKDIQLHGLLQPVLVMSFHDPNNPQYKYKLIAGYRRFMAHRILQAESIKAVEVDHLMTEAEARLFNLAENLQRKDLNILQEAKALAHLRMLGLSEEDISEQLHMSRGWTQLRCMVLELPKELYPDILAGNIVQSQIRQLYSVYRVNGTLGVINIAKKMKDDKIRGVTKNYAPKAKNTKHLRKRSELFDLIEYLLDNFKDVDNLSLATRSLSWASGEISDVELFETFKEIANKYNRTLGPMKNDIL